MKEAPHLEPDSPHFVSHSTLNSNNYEKLLTMFDVEVRKKGT